jgi:DNA uptake protein ComE-like DNA-binding protein
LQLDLGNLVEGQEGTLNLDMETGDLKALAASVYYGTRSHFYGQRYKGEDSDQSSDYQDIYADVFHRLITFYIGTEKFPIVFDLTAGDQVWNYPCYGYTTNVGDAETLDAGTVGLNTASAQDLIDLGLAESAANAIVDRIRSAKGPFARWTKVSELEAVSEEDVSKLQEGNYTLWGERKGHKVNTSLKCTTDGVDAWHLDTVDEDPRGFVKNYTYNLVINDRGDVVRGEWTGDSVEEHPDFAWLPYANEDRPSDSDDWRRHGSWENYVKHIYWSRYAPSENPFLFTDITNDMLDVRVNAPVVCNPDPDDCGAGFQCNPVDGTCTEVVVEPAPTDGCLGTSLKEGAVNAESMFEGKVCSGRDSWFLINLTEGQEVEGVISFEHSLGDIDLEFLDAAGKRLRTSTSTSNSESFKWTATVTGAYALRIYGYSGASNEISVTIEVNDTSDAQCAEEQGEPNNNSASATPIEGTVNGALCGSDSDWFKVDISGDWTASIVFEHSAGDLDLKSYDAGGGQAKVSQSTDDSETISGSGPGFIEVYGYRGATGAYVLAVE